MRAFVIVAAVLLTANAAFALEDETAEAAHMMWANDSCDLPVMREDWWGVRLAALRTFSKTQGGGGLIAASRRKLEGAMQALSKEQACDQVVNAVLKKKQDRDGPGK